MKTDFFAPLELIATENTRIITQGQRESRSPMGAILDGFSFVEQLSPKYSKVDGPVYRLCEECVRQDRWGAAPLDEKTLAVLGVTDTELLAASAPFSELRATSKPFIIEQAQDGRSVFSPNSVLVLLGYGAGLAARYPQ